MSASFRTEAQGEWPNANYDIYGVGFGFDLNPHCTIDNPVGVNLTGATGITFRHRGAAGVISVRTSQYAESFSAPIVYHAGWTQVTILFSNMQITWGDNEGTRLTNLSNVLAFEFSAPAQADARTGTIDIDHIQINGINNLNSITCTQPHYSGGYGTRSYPYLISSKTDMEALAAKVNSGETYAGKWFRLTRSLTGSNDTFQRYI
jgi:hypothetical protein